MLHIILVVLEIVGMILLGILGILLGILLIVLLVPVRYFIDGSYYGTAKCSIRVTWFLHLIVLLFQYGGENKFQIKILGVDLQKIGRRKKREKTKDEENVTVPKKVEEKHAETIGNKKDLEETKTANPDREEISAVFEKKKTKKLKQFWYKIKGFFQNIKRTVHTVSEKIKGLWEKKKQVMDLLKSEKTRVVFAIVKKEIFYLWRHIRPRKLRMRLHYGMEDPSHTGMILAMLCTLYPFYAKVFQIQPDFENKVLEGEIKTKGHIRGIHVAVSIVRVVMNKECRGLYRQITHK